MRNFLIFLIALMVVGLVIFLAFIRSPESTIYDDITVVGSAVSFVALLITLVQILKTKSVVEQTKEAVLQTRRQVETLLNVSDISRIIEYIRYVDLCIKGEKYESAHLRLCDVKDYMVKIPLVKDLQYSSDAFKCLYRKVESDLGAINQKITGDVAVNASTVCEDLEEVASFMNNIVTQLKSNS